MSAKNRSVEQIINDAIAIGLYVEGNRGVDTARLSAEFKISRSTVVRHRQLLRKLGVKINWNAKKKEFRLSNWGIFSPVKLRKRKKLNENQLTKTG